MSEISRSRIVASEMARMNGCYADPSLTCPMTLEEVRTCCEHVPIFVEMNPSVQHHEGEEDDYYIPGECVWTADNEFYMMRFGPSCILLLKEAEYGVAWRCWYGKPNKIMSFENPWKVVENNFS